jgi:polyribonucleotide nucleotidyltransferase
MILKAHDKIPVLIYLQVYIRKNIAVSSHSSVCEETLPNYEAGLDVNLH